MDRLGQNKARANTMGVFKSLPEYHFLWGIDAIMHQFFTDSSQILIDYLLEIAIQTTNLISLFDIGGNVCGGSGASKPD